VDPDTIPLAGDVGAGADGSSPSQVLTGSKIGLPHKDAPERLNRHNHYLICDKAKLVATWENNGRGWMLKTSSGMISALRNHEQLPSQGDFKLVELKLKATDDGLRLTGIHSYQLTQRWALTNLDKGDDKILGSITGSGFLNREQKGVVRGVIKDQFMRHVWEDAHHVLEYLMNSDFHSAGVG